MIHDIAILGAGPCGLALAARLREPLPSALFTDTEHARFWNRRHDKNTIDNLKVNQERCAPGHGQVKSHPLRTNKSIIVLDAASDTWMSAWREKFAKLNISHLRSPLFFHPDPRDRDGLLAYTYAEGRQQDLTEIEGVVGREVSKHSLKKGRKRHLNGGNESSCRRSARHLQLDNRDRNDYFTPSSKLFDSYIDTVVRNYELSDILCQAKVVDLSYDTVSNSSGKMFSLRTLTGDTYFARTVVLATGPASLPQIPPSSPLVTVQNNSGSATHIFDTTKPLLPPRLAHKTGQCHSTAVLIVGGGLTSAQTADLLLTQRAVSKVHLVMRSKLKVKHFDVDLPWVAKLRNRQMAEFWSADTDEERFEMLKAARGGGSITPGYDKILRAWQKKGRLEVHAEYEIDVAEERTTWDIATKTWCVSLKPSSSGPPSTLMSSTSHKLIDNIDHIIFATSTPPSIHNIPFLETIRDSHPITDITGLPVLTQDLMWRDDIPLFVSGALAGLRLGPGAGNLGGARLGAERIVWGLEDWFERNGPVDTDADVDMASNGEPGDADGATGVRRDSGYGSEDEAGEKGHLLASKSDADLLVEFTSGLGNRFAGLELLDQ